MKFLFLDIDGVLNGHEKLASGYCGIRHDLVPHLNLILDSVPDVKLVISSAWRYLTFRGDMTLTGFEYLLLLHGVKCFERLHGTTEPDDDVPSCHFDAAAWNDIGIRWRHQQIAQYVDRHRPLRYAVVDDLPLSVPYFVQTDGTVGLTKDDADKLIAILSPPTPAQEQRDG